MRTIMAGPLHFKFLYVDGNGRLAMPKGIARAGQATEEETAENGSE